MWLIQSGREFKNNNHLVEQEMKMTSFNNGLDMCRLRLVATLDPCTKGRSTSHESRLRGDAAALQVIRFVYHAMQSLLCPNGVPEH
jgi:hypothetical protein